MSGLDTLLVVLGALASADDTRGKPCTFNRDVAATCGRWGCVLPPDVDPDLHTGAGAVCGKCRDDVDCGGHVCNPDGTCGSLDPAPAPEPVWPRFHMVVADLSVNVADKEDTRPIVGVGYLFQGAFRRTHPEALPDGGWITRDLPRLYWNAGAAVALAGPAQNVLVDLGLTGYVPDLPLYVMTISVGVLVQRQGLSVWDLGDDSENSDRMGPGLTLGFLQNLFVRVAHVFPLRGPNDEGAFIVSVTYMRDLLDDLVPDRFRKFQAAVTR